MSRTVQSKPAVIGTGVHRDQPLIQARMGRGGPRELFPRVAARGVGADVGSDGEGPRVAAPARRAAARRVERDAQSAGGGPVRLHDRRRVCKLSAEFAQRSLRDIQAVTQHVGMAPQQYDEAGRMLLGLDSLQPLLRL